MKKLFFFTLLLAAMTFSARAALVFSETFSYANGVLTAVAPPNTWLHYDGAANQLDVLAGRAHLTQAEDEDVQRPISAFIGGTMYFSFLLNVSTPPPTTNAGNFIVLFKDQGTVAAPNLRAKVFVTPIGAAAGRYRVGVANGASTINAASAIIPTDLVPGTSYLLVVCYTQPVTGGIPQTILWINPCSPNDTVNRAVATDQTFSIAVNAVALSQGIGIGVLDIDNLRVATTFQEVGGDTNPPAITCPTNITVQATSAAGAVVTFAATATDNVDATPTITCVPPSGSTFPVGTNTVTCRALDDCGNGSSCTFLVIVTPRPPLQMTCPPEITVVATVATGAVVSYPQPTAGGGCPPYTVVCNPPSGSTFPVGTTTVTCTASDTCGQTNICQFRVTVRPPVGVIEVDQMDYGLADITIVLPNGAQETVRLSGPTTVNVMFEGAVEGIANDSDGNGLDDVDTEMVSLNLVGGSSLGPVSAMLRPGTRSLGRIEETANLLPGRLDVHPFGPPGSTAMSFFDVNVDIRVGAGATAMVLHPAQPLHMQGIIRHKPPAPGDTYVNPFTQPVDLLDANGNPTGIKIVREVHTPNPEQERDPFPYTQGKINLRYPNGQIERVLVAGPTEVMVNIPPNGAAADTDGDGLDQVPTEIKSLSLLGNSSQGPVMVMLDTNGCRSFGQIEEKVNNTPGTLDLPPFTPTGGANSSFDLCLKIVVNGKVYRPCGNVRVHIESMISHKPPAPGEAYMNLINQEIELCDENGTRTGIFLTGEMHTPNVPKEIDDFPNTVAQLTVRGPTGAEEVVTLTGPTRVEVSIDDNPASPGYGLAADTDGDGRDQVPSEMTLLNLTGNSSLGPVQVSLRNDVMSMGEIEESANLVPGRLDVAPFGPPGSTADSFFDIWPLITVGGQTYHTATPLHMAAIIRHKPPAPGDQYVNPFTQPVELLDANGRPTGIFVVREVHTPNPDCTIGITCPPDIKAGAIVAAGVVVNYAAPVVVATCPPVTVVCNPPSGSVFPIGTTAVTCTATDRIGKSATCQFRVTVFRRFVEVDKMPYGTALLSLKKADGTTEVVALAGPSTVEVYFDGENEGDADDSDGDGRDDVPSQITEMDLRGNSSMGPVQVTLDPERASLGGMEEQANATPGRLDVAPFAAAGAVDSFFDVFTEIRVAGRLFRPAKSLRMESVIRHKPPAPGDTYVNPFTEPIELLDENGNPTGIFVVREVHTPNIEKEIDQMPFGTAQITLALANGGTETVTLAGPTTVEVCIPPNGLAADTDGDGLDQVPTKITFMDLRGSSSVGPVRATLDPTRMTVGEIEETANTTPGVLNVPPFAPGTANSFFDVFTELTVGNMVLHPAQPIRMQSTIHHKPPGPDDTYVNPFTQPIELLDANGRPTGIRIVREVHTPNPPKETDYFSYSLGKINLQIPGRPIERVIVAGPTTVQVCIDDRPGAGQGRAADLDGDGLEEVPTVMSQLLLAGNSSMGPVQIMLDPTRPTRGSIEEKVNGTPGVLDLAPFGNQGCANSYFDVIAIIKVGERSFCPKVPLHIEAMICHKPPRPGEAYMNLLNQEPVELIDCATGQGTGIFLTGEMHTPNIPKEVDYFSYSQGKINIQRGQPGGTPSGPIERVIVAGPTRVDVCINDADGIAADTDADGLDAVPTVMTQLQLSGNSSFGPVSIMLDPNNPSTGEIEEKVNGTPGVLDLAPFGNQGCANSFFDVRPIIKIGNMTLCPKVPLHIAAMICHKPPGPGDAYMNLINQPPIELVDCASGQPTGIFIVGEMHTPVIPQEVDYFSYSQGKINIRHPDGHIERVIVAGPTRVEVGLNDADGFAADTDGDGLDQVPTHITDLNLMGNSSLGPVMVSLNPEKPTVGEIEEKVNGTPGVLDLDPFGSRGCANSFFDVYAIIKVGGRALCPETPLHIEAMICHKPPGPGEAYMNLVNQEIRLLDCASGQPTGYILTGEMHSPNPPKEIDVFPDSYAEIEIRTATGQSETLVMRGPTTVEVCIDDTPGPGFGLAADTDGDGRDEAPTQMTRFDLMGVSAFFGPVRARLDASRPTLGQIEERANNTPGVLDLPPFTATGQADSFFDVFAEFVLADGSVFHTAQPLHMQTVITHKPPGPGETYINPFTQPVELLDANGRPTGVFITREVHTPNPNCTNTIICPSNIVVWTCDSNGVPVTYPAPVVISTCPPITVACVPPSGSNFLPGNNPVTCTVRDTQGNSNSCTFTVRVIRDTTPPGLTCPSNIVMVTCNERERVVWTVSATDDCDTNLTVVCNPPSGTVFPVGSHVVTCTASDDCGNRSTCQFRIEIRRSEAVPQLTITPLPNGRIRICWSGSCTGWVLQCATDLNPPIAWRTVTNTPTVIGGVNCVILPATGKIQVYRLSKRDAQVPEVYAETDTFPPQGVYDASDEVTSIPVPGLPRPVLARWFRHPIPPPDIFPPRPPPCFQCPPDTFRFMSDLDFQVSLDDGTIWVDVHPEPKLNVSVAVLVAAQPPDPGMPDVRSFDTEILQLDGTFMMMPAGAGGAGEGAAQQRLMLRESPTKKSTGKTSIRESAVGDGTFMISSFFDVFIEVSMDDGQTWVPAATPVRMTLGSKPTEQFAATDAFPPAGTYNTPRAQVNRYENGILTRWYLHRLQPIPIPIPIPKPNPPCLTCPPVDFRFSTEILFQASVDGGGTWMDVGAMSDVGIRLRQSRALGDTRYFNMEMDMLNIQSPVGGAGGAAAGVMLRESPTLPSKGKTSVRKLPDGTYRIGSFFDIFTEISLDGGQTWKRSIEASHVDYIAAPPPQYAASDALPAPGTYDSPAAQVTTFDNGILARWYRHRIPPVLCPPFCPQPGPCLFCPPDPFEFDTEISFQVSNDGGRSWLDVHADSHVKGGIVPCAGAGGVLTYDTEITQLDVHGSLGPPGIVPVPFMLRESPTRRSLGFTEVQKFPDGTFRIGSFFDIFTEISLDGGQTWHVSKEATHVVQQSAPTEQYEAAATFPPVGSYNSPSPEITDFGGGILTRWYLHKIPPFPPGGCPFCPPPPCLQCPPEIYRFDTDIVLQWSRDGGQTWNDAIARSRNTIRVNQVMEMGSAAGPQPSPWHAFETEMLQLDISGGTMPAGVMIRESPTRQSLGRTTVRQLAGLTAAEPGGYRVGSFFDVWPEITLDGGQHWMAARKPSHVELVAQPPAVGERTDTFPPAGSYNSPSNEITRFPNGILARRYRHPIIIPPIIPRPPPCLTCPPEIYEFQTDLLFEFSLNGGQTWQEGRAPSQVVVQATTCWLEGGLRGYVTEMLRLDAQIPVPGTPGVRLRESPTRQSMGMTSVMDSPSLSLPFNVDSFFDIFTELSVDGGQTWGGSTEATHVELNPQPLPPGQ